MGLALARMKGWDLPPTPIAELLQRHGILAPQVLFRLQRRSFPIYINPLGSIYSIT